MLTRYIISICGTLIITFYAGMQFRVSHEAMPYANNDIDINVYVIIVKQILTYLHARMNRLALCTSN